MIIYGSRSTHLKSSNLPNAKCPCGESKGKLTASVFGRHVHVFWIPLFPVGKKAVFECKQCHKGFKKKELGEDAKLAYKNFKGTVKTPLWKYTGLAIIAILIGMGIYSSIQNDKKVVEYLENPAMFDTYTFKTESNYYSTFKIVEVFQDSVFVNYNDYETDKISGIRKIDLKKNYSSEVYVLTNNAIKSMFDQGYIKDIDR
ncbi:hypothetical protein [Croceivirga thetidis]|uniref:Zinc-ribbon 15 domain-containing protein n=1 Tax=Croceivirga thetidis TaxID=2721623 RepID=A0ABX1GS24_9FLAO|nr:hypothetical protein [Croceivirga thetidis]NKI32433.1 hypothetical protein [Croceivirga thetidis]